MSDNPATRLNIKGVIPGKVNSGTHHHSIVEYKGKWNLFYHNSDLFLRRNPTEAEKNLKVTVNQYVRLIKIP